MEGQVLAAENNNKDTHGEKIQIDWKEKYTVHLRVWNTHTETKVLPAAYVDWARGNPFIKKKCASLFLEQSVSRTNHFMASIYIFLFVLLPPPPPQKKSWWLSLKIMLGNPTYGRCFPL